MTSIKQVLYKLVEQKDTIILDAELVNYTPLMLGDYTGQTHKIIHNGTGTDVILADPTKAIIGKSRWLLRTLIATLGQARTHTEAEKWPDLTVKDCNGKIIAKNLGLVQLLYGSTSPSWKGLYTVQSRIILDTSTDTDIVNTTLLNIVPRLKLLMLSKKTNFEKYLITPIDVNKARLKLKILRRNQCLKITLNNTDTEKYIDIEELDKLVISLTLITLQILGIGAIANRGFGRFYIENIDTPYDTDSPINELKKLTRYKSNENSDFHIITIKENIKNIFKQTIKIISDITYIKDNYRIEEAFEYCYNKKDNNIKQKCKIRPLVINDIRVYKVDNSIINKILEYTSRNYKNKISEGKIINIILKIIGLITLKHTWKSCNKEDYKGGGGYHTWILGLPRTQKITYYKIYKIKDKSVFYDGCYIDVSKYVKENNIKNIPSIPSGYMILKDSKYSIISRTSSYAKLVKVKINGLNNIYTAYVHKEYIKDSSIENIDFNSTIMLYSVRSQSPFIIFPLIDNINCNNINTCNPVIIIIPFYPIDLEDIIDNLYHIGGLASKYSMDENLRVKFLDAVRLERVIDIHTRGTNTVVVRCKNATYTNKCISRYARPCTKTHECNDDYNRSTNSSTSVVRDAYEAALEFFDKLLTSDNCCSLSPQNRGDKHE